METFGPPLPVAQLSLICSHACSGEDGVRQLPPTFTSQFSHNTGLPGGTASVGCSTASALQAHTHARPPALGGQRQAQLVLALGRGSMETLQEVSPVDRTHFSL